MAFTELNFTHDWTRSDDETGFPTYQAQESKVRSDLQLLHNETREAFNRLVNDELKASFIPFAGTAGKLPSTSVQLAIETLYDMGSEARQGVVSDNAITSAKLSKVVGEEAVTTATIRDEAITNDKIKDGTITADKLDAGVLQDLTLGDGQVKKNNIAAGAVTNSKIEEGTIEGDRLMGGIIVNRHVADYSATVAGTGINGNKIQPGTIPGDRLITVPANKIENGVTSDQITSLATSKLSGTISNDQLAGSISADKLAGSIPFSKLTATAVTTSERSDTGEVTCAGVTATSNIIVTPHPDSFLAWRNQGVRCTAQGNGTITLTFESTGTNVKANVLIFN